MAQSYPCMCILQASQHHPQSHGCVSKSYAGSLLCRLGWGLSMQIEEVQYHYFFPQAGGVRAGRL